MVKKMDKIQFEYRSEINETVTAIDTFLEEHPHAGEKETVTRLRDLLEVMYIGW